MFRKRPSTPTTHPDDADQPSAARAKIGKDVSAKLARNPMIERLGDARLDLFLRRDFASPEECAALRAMIDAGAQPSILFSGTQGPEYRTSHSCHMERGDPLVERITARICAVMGVPPDYTETLQGQRYTPGQEYKPHWDYFPQNDTYWPQMREMGVRGHVLHRRRHVRRVRHASLQPEGRDERDVVGQAVEPAGGVAERKALAQLDELDAVAAEDVVEVHAQVHEARSVR
jgi:hypothetical protein